MPLDFDKMSNSQAGFREFVGASENNARAIADLIQSKGEKTAWRQFKTKLKLKAKNKTAQKVVAGTLVVAGVAAAPFTGGVSGVAAAALAAAMWGGDKVINGITSKLSGANAPDKAKDAVKSALQHMEKASRFGSYLANWQPTSEDVQVQNADGQDLLKYDPNVATHLFKFAHHVWKAELRLQELEQIAADMRKGINAAKGLDEQGQPLPGQDPQQLVERSWAYVVEKLKIARAMAITDVFDPKQSELQSIAERFADYVPGPNGPVRAPQPPPVRPLPPLPQGQRPPQPHNRPLPPLPQGPRPGQR